MDHFLYQFSFLSALIPTVLRVLVGCYFAYMAWFINKESSAITNTRLPIIGRPTSWMVQVSATILALVAAMSIVGFQMRLAALLGIIISLKHIYGLKHFPQILPFTKSTYILLCVICITLLVSGAGILALDSPLF